MTVNQLDRTKVAGLLRVNKQKYFLPPEKMKLLKGSRTDQVFTTEFLAGFPVDFGKLTMRGLMNVLGAIRRASAGMSLESFVEMGYDEISNWTPEGEGTRQGMGPAAMAFLIDFLASFGLVLEGAPARTDSRTKPVTGKELVAALKAKKK